MPHTLTVTATATESARLLSASELRYRRLFEAAKDGILILNVDTGRIEDVNPYLLTLLGLARGDAIGKTVGELSPFRDMESNQIMLERLQRNGYVRYGHLPLEAVDGRKVAVEFVSNVYEAGDRKVIQCNIRDITERLRDGDEIRALTAARARDITAHELLGAQLIEAQKMEVVGQLAAGVAHDFNNMLAVIMGYADIIASELPAGSRVHEYTEEIRHASDRAVGLTRQLLLFSRKHKVQPAVLDLNEVVKDLDKMLGRLIDEQIIMTIVPDAHLGWMKADAGYLGQMLMNMVVNARDAMPEGGTITIATANVTIDAADRSQARIPPGRYVVLSIADTGTGMTAEVKAHLFEAFFTTKEKGKGTGLGLSTCQTIVQESGGHIAVQSEAGQGTTLTMYFPRVDTPPAAVAVAAPVAYRTRGSETIMVVEDEPSVRHLARDVLQAQGYTVLSASNGQDGLRVAREHKGTPIRLVITDVVMPLMGGKVMAEWLKSSDASLDILYTSGYPDQTIADDHVLASGVSFLAKPYTLAALTKRVRDMLDRPPAAP